MIDEKEYLEATETGKKMLEALTAAYNEQKAEHDIVKQNGAEILITIELDDELLERLESSKKNGFEILNLIGKELKVELGQQVNSENTGLEIMSIKLLKQLEEQEKDMDNSKEYAIQLSVKAVESKTKTKASTTSKNKGM
jgi:hypothetical protein